MIKISYCLLFYYFLLCTNLFYRSFSLSIGNIDMTILLKQLTLFVPGGGGGFDHVDTICNITLTIF